MREKTHVESCPQCETRFVGVSPDEYRNEHAPQCNPLTALYVFPAGSGEGTEP